MTDISNTIDNSAACETYRKELTSSFWKIRIAYHFLCPDSQYLMELVKRKEEGLSYLRNRFEESGLKIRNEENLKLEAKLLKLTAAIEKERMLVLGEY